MRKPDITLDAMVATLEHRGPDDRGVWSDPAHGVFLGHRRLSVIDLSTEGHQPMASRSGRYVITYNGEVFNYAELRSELGPSRWRGHSDTEVMLEAFDRWGVEGAVKRFNGQFAFAVWDAVEKRLVLVRDRMGIKPLYVGHFGDTLLFGSELKSLRAHPAFDASIDPLAVTRYLELGYIPGELSIYRGVRKLLPGHLLEVRRSDEMPAPRSYWAVEDVVDRLADVRRDPKRAQPSAVVEELEARLSDAVRLRLIADVPVGAFLSGGIDSSLIVSLMMRERQGPVRTFSVGFEEDRYDEAPHATRIAAHLGTDHTNLYVKPEDVFGVLQELPGMYDEPFADVSQIPTALVSRLARQSVTVSLSGDGGDELFGGYGRYERAVDYWRRISRIPASLRTAVRGAATPLALVERSHVGKRTAYAVARRLNRHVMPGQAARQLELVGAADAMTFYARSIRLSANGLTAPGLPAFSGESLRAPRPDLNLSFLESMTLADMVAYLPDDILVKVDRASMYVALEVRVPFLDHRVVELAWSIPVDMKLRDGTTKWILRELLKRHVPEALFDRPKQGFTIPLGSWLRGPLRDWGESLLNESAVASAGLLDPSSVRGVWDDHLAGRGDLEMLLWRLIALQQWADAHAGALRNVRTAEIAS